MSVRKPTAIGLAIGLILGIASAIFVGSAMLWNNNNGEFADTVTGEWTGHFWMLMGLTIAIVAIPITGFFALFGLIGKIEPIERQDDQV